MSETTISTSTEQPKKEKKEKREKKVIETCSICTEELNKTTRLTVACPYCSHSACRECYKRWLLMESRAHCMNNECNVEWTITQLVKLFPYTFIKNEYKKHQENVLYDRERALMPETQIIIEEMIRREHKEEEIQEIYNKIRVLYRKIEDLRYEIRLSEREKPNVRERAAFIRACPEENCRGFLSSQWKCGICEKWTCPQCHVVKGLVRDVEHVCDPNDLATATLISSDTRPCPNCGTGIFKISGCDQMFCVECNTGFNWRTGRIETNVHNPHYFEWLRRTGGGGDQNRNIQNIQQCRDREITSQYIRTLLSQIRSITIIYGINTNDVSTWISNLGQATIHNRNAEMTHYHINRIMNNRELRIKFMRNVITEDEFKEKIQRQEKKTNKYRACYDVYQLLQNTITDIILRFDNKLREDMSLFKKDDNEHNKNIFNNIVKILDETRPIIEYANDCFAEISKVYGSTRIVLNENGLPNSRFTR